MRQSNLLHAVLFCMLLVCATSCDKEERDLTEDNLPAAIQKDLSERYPGAEIKTSYKLSDGLLQIDFTDEIQNQGSVYYTNETWKMTHTKLFDSGQLPLKVQQAFYNSGYGNAKIEDIYETKRDGIERTVYTLHFKYRWKKVEDVEHYVFINDDGLLLSTISCKPNDPCWFINLPAAHFDFITKKYKGAEIRAYINEASIHVYLILHEGIIKKVSFRGESPDERDFWKETRYEISLDTKIPENVIQNLKRTDPDFTYTNLYYIESGEGNAYLFEDQKRDNNLGYIIGENV